MPTERERIAELEAENQQLRTLLRAAQDMIGAQTKALEEAKRQLDQANSPVRGFGGDE